MTSPARVIGVGLGVVVAWGLSFFFIKASLTLTSPFGVAFGRCAIGALTLLTIPASRRVPPRSCLGRIALLASVWMVVPMVLFAVAEQRIDSSLAGMINGSTPLFTAIVAVLLGRERLVRRLSVGLLIGFVGVLLVCAPTINAGPAMIGPALLVLAAVACYGVAFNLAGSLQREHGALPVSVGAMTIAALVLAPMGVPELVGARGPASGAGALLALGIMSTGLGFAGFTWLAGTIGATRASVVTYFVPVTAVAAGAVFAGEPFHPASGAGLAAIIAGAALVQKREPAAASAAGSGDR